MKQREIDGFFRSSGTASVFVAVDPYGIYKPYPQNKMVLHKGHGDYERFREFIASNVKDAMAYVFIPEAYIQYYVFRDTRSMPEVSTVGWNIYPEKTLLPYCNKVGIEAAHTIKLRDAVYAIENGIDVNELIKGATAFRDEKYEKFIDEQNDRERIYKSDPDYKLPLRILATNKGNLIFSACRIGEEGYRQYVQNIADNYFNPELEIDNIRFGQLDYVTPQYSPHINKSYKRTADGITRFHSFPDSSYTSPKEIPELIHNMNQVAHLDLKPEHHAYENYIEFTGTRSKPENVQISRLLQIKETGYFNLYSKTFDYSDVFEDLGNQFQELSHIKNASEFDADKFNKLREATIAEADNILKSYLNVRGHQSLDKELRDPKKEITLGDFNLSGPYKQVLADGHMLVLPPIQNFSTEQTYAFADFKKNKIILSPIAIGQNLYEVKEGKAVPYKGQSSHESPEPMTGKKKISKSPKHKI